MPEWLYAMNGYVAPTQTALSRHDGNTRSLGVSHPVRPGDGRVRRSGRPCLQYWLGYLPPSSSFRHDLAGLSASANQPAGRPARESELHGLDCYSRGAPSAQWLLPRFRGHSLCDASDFKPIPEALGRRIRPRSFLGAAAREDPRARDADGGRSFASGEWDGATRNQQTRGALRDGIGSGTRTGTASLHVQGNAEQAPPALKQVSSSVQSPTSPVVR